VHSQSCCARTTFQRRTHAAPAPHTVPKWAYSTVQRPQGDGPAREIKGAQRALKTFSVQPNSVVLGGLGWTGAGG